MTPPAELTGPIVDHDGIAEWWDCRSCGCHTDPKRIVPTREQERAIDEGRCVWCGGADIGVRKPGRWEEIDQEFLDQFIRDCTVSEQERQDVWRVAADQWLYEHEDEIAHRATALVRGEHKSGQD